MKGTQAGGSEDRFTIQTNNFSTATNITVGPTESTGSGTAHTHAVTSLALSGSTFAGSDVDTTQPWIAEYRFIAYADV